MPDDQFAPQTTIHASFPVTEEALSGQLRDRISTPASSAAEIRPDALIQRQEAMIRRAFNAVRDEPRNVTRSYMVTKRVLDLMIALPLLIVTAPLMLIIAGLIRLDSSGPALFVQHRVGKGGHLFRMIKFRTMSDGCSMLRGASHKVEDDHRVTRIGRILRSTSLDELPQLINVVLGQMSLVGPRPELPTIVLQKYQPWQYRRLEVPQGITGWWQVTGRGSKILWKHTGDDLYYVEQASLWFDIKLLFLTFKAVISREGAF